jgi:hypothetical protein
LLRLINSGPFPVNQDCTETVDVFGWAALNMTTFFALSANDRLKEFCAFGREGVLETTADPSASVGMTNAVDAAMRERLSITSGLESV